VPKRLFRRGLRRRRRWLVLTIFVVLYLVGTGLLGAVTAGADPPSTWQLPATTAIQFQTDPHGVRYPYVMLPTGGRWYLECPLQVDAATHSLTPSLALNTDHDRCGDDTGATHPYPGASWNTTTYASVNVDPGDIRCGQLVAHRADAIPPDAASPRFCTDRVLVYPTLNSAVARALATWWPERVLDRCPPAATSGLACEGIESKSPGVPLEWWHGDGHGGVDCGRIPTDHVPDSIASWAGADSTKLGQACAVMNNFFAGTPLSFTPSTDLLQAVRQALQDSGPTKSPAWSHAVKGKDVKVGTTGLDWNLVGGLVGGCLVGGGLGGLAAGGVGLVIGCAAGAIAGQAVASWLESQDCALTSWHCIVNAVGRWLAKGFVKELNFGLDQLVHGPDPAALFGQDEFIRLWQALVLISALFATLYGLIALGVSAAVLRPSIAITSLRNIAVWGWALAMAIPFTSLVLAAVDGLTTTITTLGAGSSWADLAGRFQATMTAALNSALPGDNSVTVDLLLFLGILVGALAALFMALWAIGRAAAVAIAVLGLPLGLAGLVGPLATRRAPQVALSTLFGLILFKPATAVVFLLGVGLMGHGTSGSAFLVGVLCLLAAAFAPWRIIRLFGAGIEHVSHGAAGHAAVIGGATLTALGVGALYQQSRGLWVPSSRPAAAGTGTATPAGPGAPGGPGTDGRDGRSDGVFGRFGGSGRRPPPGAAVPARAAPDGRDTRDGRDGRDGRAHSAPGYPPPLSLASPPSEGRPSRGSGPTPPPMTANDVVTQNRKADDR
jgi:hypothetical protein